MAHAAKVNDDGIVEQVIVVPDGLGGDENDAAITAYCNQIGIPGKFVRTSYNGNIRQKYAGIGDRYDAENDVFVSPVVEEPEAP